MGTDLTLLIVREVRGARWLTQSVRLARQYAIFDKVQELPKSPLPEGVEVQTPSGEGRGDGYGDMEFTTAGELAKVDGITGDTIWGSRFYPVSFKENDPSQKVVLYWH